MRRDCGYHLKISRGNIYDWVLRNGNYDFERTGALMLRTLPEGLIPRK